MVLELVYYVAASVDGYIARPDGGLDWLTPYEGGDEDYGYAQFYKSVDAVLMGRKTYEKSLSFGVWPYPGKPCWVFSHGSAKNVPADVVVTTQSPALVVSEIASRGIKRAWLVGGGALAASFQFHGLITEYIVTIIPVILGDGIPLFAPSGSTEKLRLVEAKQYPSGLMQLRYLRSA